MNTVALYILKGAFLTAVFFGCVHAQIVVKWRHDIFYRVGNVIAYESQPGKLPAGVNRFRAIKPNINRAPVDNSEYWQLTSVGVEEQSAVSPSIDIQNRVEQTIQQAASAPSTSQAALDIKTRMEQQTQIVKQQGTTSQASLDIQARIEQQIKDQIAAASAISEVKASDAVLRPSSGGSTAQGDAVIRDWYSINTYAIGQQVRSEGMVWVALYINNNEKPGTTAAWLPKTIGPWYSKVPYVKGSVVIAQGVEYTAQHGTTGQNPVTDKTGVWVTKTGDRSAVPIDKSGQTGGTSQVIDGNTVITYESNNRVVDLSKYPAWKIDFNYRAGAEVVYKAALWRAKESNKDCEPSTCKAWTPVTVTVWYPRVEYVAKDVVIWKDKRYIAQWWTTEVPPDLDAEGNWTWVDANNHRIPLFGQLWDKAKVYVRGDKVFLDDVEWQALEWTRGDQPGKTGVWRPLVITKWYSGVRYQGQDIVLWKNKRYIARWYRENIQPDIDPEGIWREIDVNNQIIPISGQSWSAQRSYLIGDKVYYSDGRNQVEWVSKWNSSQNNKPCATDAWKPPQRVNWCSGVGYNQYDIVLWNNKTYSAREYRLNTQPDTDPQGLWREIDANNQVIPLSGQPWLITRVYFNGDKVRWNNLTWRAKWWTQGETPGIADVWEQTP